jgi:hypothetical protein
MSAPTTTYASGDFDDFRAWEVECADRPEMDPDVDWRLPPRHHRPSRQVQKYRAITDSLTEREA